MRRFLAFVMCFSGFTLAVSWSRGAEPAAAAATEDQLQQAESAVESSARPEVVPIQPRGNRDGEASDSPHASDTQAGDASTIRRERLDSARLKNWLRLYEHQTANGTAAPFVETLIRQLGQLEERMERLPDGLDRFQGVALDEARKSVENLKAETEREIGLIEQFLKAVDDRKATATKQSTDKVQTVAAEGEVPAGSSRVQTDEREPRRRERNARVQEERPDAAGGDPIVQRLEQELQRLREMATQVQDSAAEEAKGVREEVERQIDNVEHFLAERRQQRDAAAGVRDRAPPAPIIAGTMDGRPEVARLRHLRAAIEHLEAAGMGEIAGSLRPHADNLQREIERQMAESGRGSAEQEGRRAAFKARVAEMERAQADRKAREQELKTVPAEVRELAEQVRELHRELRELRQEVGEIRQAGGERSEE